MTAYDKGYDPAFPVLQIEVSSHRRGAAVRSVAVLLDTGADGTILPSEVLQAVEARYVEQRQLRGILGQSQVVDVYSVTLHIGSQRIYGVRAVSAPAGVEPLLGRDVLNQLRVTFDGPAEIVEIDP